MAKRAAVPGWAWGALAAAGAVGVYLVLRPRASAPPAPTWRPNLQPELQGGNATSGALDGLWGAANDVLGGTPPTPGSVPGIDTLGTDPAAPPDPTTPSRARIPQRAAVTRLQQMMNFYWNEHTLVDGRYGPETQRRYTEFLAQGTPPQSAARAVAPTDAWLNSEVDFFCANHRDITAGQPFCR